MIQNNIQFDIKNEEYTIINKKVSRDSYLKIQSGKNNSIINAISIDWNNAKVDDNTYINTTGELLSWIKNLNSNKTNLTEEQLEALNYVVEFVKQIKGKSQIIDETDYLIYIGVDRPDENTNPLNDLAIDNNIIIEGTKPMGWRSIGQDISIYNAGNPAYNGGLNTICLDANFNDVQCYVAVPVGMHMYDGLGNLTASWTLDQENITIKGHQYSVYVDTLEGEFGEIIY